MGRLNGQGDDPAPPSRPDPGAARPPIYGALDLGTNNCRLLIAKPTATDSAPSIRSPASSGLARSLSITGELGRRGDGAHARRAGGLPVEARGARRRRAPISSRPKPAARRATAKTSLLACRANSALSFASSTARRRRRWPLPDRAALADPHAAGVLLVRHRRRLFGDRLAGRAGRCARTSETSDAIRRRMKSWTSLPLGVVTLADRFGGRDVDERCFEAMVGFRVATPWRISSTRRGSRAMRTLPSARNLWDGDHGRRLFSWTASATTGGGSTDCGCPSTMSRAQSRRSSACRSGARRAGLHRPRSGRSRAWRAAPFSKRSAAPFPATACASPIAACARAS